MTREGLRVPEWWWSVLLSFIPINPDNRPAICGHLKTGAQYRGLLSKWWNQILWTLLFYIIHLKIQHWNWTINPLLCVWSSNCYVPSASQVTRMVSSSLSQCAIEGAWPGPIVAITHPLWHRRPTPGVECPQGLTTGTHWPPGRLHPDGHQSTGQTQHLIMPSRNTSKGSSSVLCCLPPFLCYIKFKKFCFIENFFYTHQTRLWLIFTTKKPWNKVKVVKLVMAIVHCKTEIIDFAAIQN